MTDATMQALVWHGGDRVTVDSVARPGKTPGRAIVDVSYAGICGTDLHICSGQHPRAQAGLIMGHEVVGVLAHDAGDLKAGTKVFINPLISCGQCVPCKKGLTHVCDKLGLYGIDQPGGLAEQVSVPVECLIALPADLDMIKAGLIEPLAVTIRSVRRSGMKPGDRVHILGAGPIGLLIALTAKYYKAGEITISEPNPSRAQTARDFGFNIYEGDPDRRADVLFDCTGHPSVSESTTKWVATGGTLMVVGVYPGVVGINLQEVLFRELNIRSVRVYDDSDIAESVSIISSDGIPGIEKLVTAVMPLSEGPEAIIKLKSGQELKVLVQGVAPGEKA